MVTRKISQIMFGCLIFALVFIVPQFQCQPNVQASDPATNEAFLEVFASRRSVRIFKSTPVPKEHIEKILKAASSAPSAGNQQPWNFLVIQEEASRMKLKQACIDRSLERIKGQKYLTAEQAKEREAKTIEYYDNCFTAPVFVIVLIDNECKYPTYTKWDGPLAAGYLLLAARALGYGTVHYTDTIPEEVTKEVFNIPDRYSRVMVTPIGIPEEWPESPSKKMLDDMVSWEKL